MADDTNKAKSIYPHSIPSNASKKNDAAVVLKAEAICLQYDAHEDLCESLMVSISLPGIAHDNLDTNAKQVCPGVYSFEATTFGYPMTGSVVDLETVKAATGKKGKRRVLGQFVAKKTKQGVLLPHRATKYVRASAAAGVRAVRSRRSSKSVVTDDEQDEEVAIMEQKLDTKAPEYVTSIEFVLWSKRSQDREYLGESVYYLGDWCKTENQKVDWAATLPVWLPLLSRDGKSIGKLQVRVGLDLNPEGHVKDTMVLYQAMCQAVEEAGDVSIFDVPATETIGMVEEEEEFSDDGMTESDSDDEAGGSFDTDDMDSMGPSSAHSDAPLEPEQLPMTKLQMEPVRRESIRRDGVHSDSESTPRRRLLPLRGRRKNRERALSSVTPTDSQADSDAEGSSDGEAVRRPWRPRIRKLRATTKTEAAEVSETSSKTSTTRRSRKQAKKARKAELKKQKGTFSFKAEIGHEVLGIVMLEVVSAKNLPRWRNMTYTSFDMDPFVVVSFNRKVFRTRVLRHTLNPEWREKLFFHVRSSERSYNIRCAVYDWDNISANDYVGELSLDVTDIMDHAPRPHPDTGLYDMDMLETMGMMSYDLPLKREDRNEDTKFGPERPTLQLKASYQPYEALRQKFWREMLRMYDSNNTGGIDADELQSMVLSLGGTLSQETIMSFFERLGKDAQNDELTFEEGIGVLEEAIKTPWDQRRKYLDLDDVDDDEEDGAETPLKETTTSVERVIRLQTCPLCGKPRLSNADEMDIVTHLALCAKRQGRAVDDIMVSSFVTATQARRKWYTNVFTVLSQGHYRLGANSANILVQDRLTGQLVEEKMQVYVRLGIRLLYKGVQGKMAGARARRMLRNMTFKQGQKYDQPSSTRAIRPFIAFHNINEGEMVEPVEAFTTFNDFFCRRIHMSLRPVADPDEPSTMVSCADCRLLAFPSVERATQLWIKGRQFTVDKLLGAAAAQHLPSRCALTIFRLAPQDYHRFHSPVDGRIGTPTYIDGEYYTVNPMAIRSAIDVYGENVRTVLPIYTREFGLVYLVAIGAMMVGSIVLSVKPDTEIRRGEELGYFKFGGSTLVLLVDGSRIQWDDDLLLNADTCIETLVQVGMRIGVARV